MDVEKAGRPLSSGARYPFGGLPLLHRSLGNQDSAQGC